jgi:activator of HSP90 ATPase
MCRNIVLAATLPSSPDRLFDMYLDPAVHAAFIGQLVSIAPRAGAQFRAFGGVLSGMILHVEPKRLIVQTWRSANWPGAAGDSVLVLSFSPQGEEGRIDLVHVNVPDSDFAGVSQGWEKYYWGPWRRYLLGEVPA